jgi:hypothetical protein
VIRGKVSPKLAIFGHKIAKPDREAVKEIYRQAEQTHVQLNLYVVGYEDDENAEPVPQPAAEPEPPAESSVPDAGPADKSPTFPGPGEGPADKSPTFPGPGEGSPPEQPPTESETS